MADATQLLTIGMPTLAVLVGILVNNSRLSDLKSSMDTRFTDLTSRFEARFAAVDRRFEDDRRYNDVMFKMILEKLDDIEARFAR